MKRASIACRTGEDEHVQLVVAIEMNLVGSIAELFVFQQLVSDVGVANLSLRLVCVQ